LSAGRLWGLAALAVLGIAAFLLLLDTLYRKDDPYAPWYTGQMSQTVAASIALAVMVLCLVAEVALLLPRPEAASSWGPGATCLSCGTWAERAPLDGRCVACGAPWPI
jgi:hypothetical protein